MPLPGPTLGTGVDANLCPRGYVGHDHGEYPSVCDH